MKAMLPGNHQAELLLESSGNSEPAARVGAQRSQEYFAVYLVSSSAALPWAVDCEIYTQEGRSDIWVPKDFLSRVLFLRNRKSHFPNSRMRGLQENCMVERNSFSCYL